MSTESAPKSRWKRGLLVACIATLVAGLAAEGVFRATLFGDGFFRERLGQRLRRPKHYANATADENYWKLQVAFMDPERLRDIPRPDPDLGWVGERVEPVSYEVEPFGPTDGRR